MIISPEQQLRDNIQNIIWNVYRESDEAEEGGAVEYRMNRVMKEVLEYTAKDPSLLNGDERKME